MGEEVSKGPFELASFEHWFGTTLQYVPFESGFIPFGTQHSFCVAVHMPLLKIVALLYPKSLTC